ncbi:hypothetical protein EJP82_20840 [Paenibacillus anaericanus]|uniref:DUF5659 domain-containing protein n=1 Tax=Paenibacillus anaericanus TaxID=170367 RepID=A0A3S1DEU5_9BACL|nr:hypothetical protein [Paenibacillus anaericanus]RUT43265.1 hypothetical protein EJP82_20840 [Paenibacillus anaericanus]
MNTLNKHDFFYCYSLELFKFLKFQKNIDYVCTAYHERTHNKFWQFAGTDELQDAISEYRKLNKNGI